VRFIKVCRVVVAGTVLGSCTSQAPVFAPPAPQKQIISTPPPRATTAAPGPSALPAPGPVRHWEQLRKQAALRMLAANPGSTYSGTVIEPLLAIPVLEIELNADGSIRKIDTLRPPSQATDTIELAHAAVRRAAPFGDVSRLPKPWRFTETFLFNDERQFKPRSLDEGK
jgi:hypothetical protein